MVFYYSVLGAENRHWLGGLGVIRFGLLDRDGRSLLSAAIGCVVAFVWCAGGSHTFETWRTNRGACSIRDRAGDERGVLGRITQRAVAGSPIHSARFYIRCLPPDAPDFGWTSG